MNGSDHNLAFLNHCAIAGFRRTTEFHAGCYVRDNPRGLPEDCGVSLLYSLYCSAGILPPAEQIHALEVERRGENDLTWIHDAIDTGLAVRKGTDGSEAAAFLKIAHIDLEGGTHFVVEKTGAIAGE